MNHYLLAAVIYCVIAVLSESIWLYSGWKKMKVHPHFIVLKNAALGSANGKWLLKNAWIFIVFVIIPVFIIFCPFLFAFTLGSNTYKLFFGKSKLQKDAEAEGERFIKAQQASEDFLKNKGRGVPFPETLEQETITPPEFITEPIPELSKEEQIINLVLAIPAKRWKRTNGYNQYCTDYNNPRNSVRIYLHDTTNKIQIGHLYFNSNSVPEKRKEIQAYFVGSILKDLSEPYIGNDESIDKQKA